MVETLGEDPGLDLRADGADAARGGPGTARDEGLHAADLEGAADLVERVAVVAHQPADRGNVAEFLDELSKESLPGYLGQDGYSVPSWFMGGLVKFSATQGAGVVALRASQHLKKICSLGLDVLLAWDLA